MMLLDHLLSRPPASLLQTDAASHSPHARSQTLMAQLGSAIVLAVALLHVSSLLSAEGQRRRVLTQATPGCGEFGGKLHVALLVADPGTFSGSAEERYLLANLNTPSAGSNRTVCGSRRVGVIMGQRVLLVTTGIGPITAALCVRELLECRPYISEMVYMGTSGWSTQIGGVLNGDGTVNPSTKVMRIGDLCISPFAVNWECQQADWTQQCSGYPNVDVLPQDTFGPTASFLYGQCLFTQAVKASVKLTKEIVEVGRSQLAYLQRPARPAKVLSLESQYFGNLSAGTGVKYDYQNPQQATGVYDHKTCSEIDAQFFYSGVPWDMSAREFTASLLNEVWEGTRNFTQKNVIAVSAMEAIGMSFAIQQYNMFAKKRIPYTVIRGNSDWLHFPVTKLKDGTWRQVAVEQDFATGYAYAIASYSSVVLTWLQSRCTAQVLSGALQGPASTVCKFTLDYN